MPSKKWKSNTYTNTKKKEYLNDCEVPASWLISAKKRQAVLESKRGSAIKRLAENTEVAPTLAPSQRETNAPVINIEAVPQLLTS